MRRVHIGREIEKREIEEQLEFEEMIEKEHEEWTQFLDT